LGAFGEGLYFYIWPLYILELKAEPIQLGLLFSLIYLVSSITPIPGGLLADKYDRKKVVLFAWTLWAFSPLLYSMASDWTQLLPGSALWGFSMIGAPAISTYIVTAAPEKNLTYVFSVVTSTWSLGYIFSPTLGGYLSATIGMKGVLNLSFIFTIACVGIWFFISSQYAASKTTQPKQERNGSNRGKMLHWAIFYGAITFVTFIPKPYFPTFFQQEIGLNNFFVGILGSATFLGSFVLGILFGKLGDRVGGRRAIFLCTITYILAVGLTILFPVISILFLASFLIGSINSIGLLISSMVSRFAPARNRARWMAVPQTTSMLGAFFAPFLGGFLYEFSPYYPFIAAISATPFLAILVAMNILWKRKSK
jgi:ENTS family enterobactin (siderophore) exporter